MLDALTARMHIGLAPNCVAVVRAGGRLRRAIQDEGTHAWTTASSPSALEVGEALRSLLANMRCRGLRAEVVLSDDLVRHWMVTPPVNARSVDACRLAAQARFVALFDEGTDGWRWGADWRVDRPFLASALPLDWLAMLQQVCSAHGMHLLSVSPELVSVWNRWRRHLCAGDWLASACGGRVTLAALDAGGLQQVGRAFLSSDDAAVGDAADPRLHRMVEREALRWMLDMPQRLRWWGPISSSARHPAAPEGPGSSTGTGWSCFPLTAHPAAVAPILAAAEAVRPGLRLAMAAW
ncbi:MAG: hypothetical protein WCI59_12835 [Betaproteobacteria bacterium]